MTSGADDAWLELVDLLAAAAAVQILEGGSAADLGLLGLTERSYLGATIVHTGGITVDHGWLRLLGGAGSDLPSLAEVNAASSGLCVVGFDVLGGVFALDGGALGTGDGHVHYFAPDTLEWGDLEIGHSQFIRAMLSESINQFYEDFRWGGWREDVETLELDRGIALYPPLFTAAGKIPNSSSRRAVPMIELVGDHWPKGPGAGDQRAD